MFTRIFVFEFEYSYYSIGQGKFLPIAIMSASHFVRNGNDLSMSSWLTTEVQVCRNVGLPNNRILNLVLLESTWINLSNILKNYI